MIFWGGTKHSGTNNRQSVSVDQHLLAAGESKGTSLVTKNN